ncbi:MAG: HlyC/CorC family transporter [Chloroflexi bacterium]|nr:HlyC/CorC family transporter [Chloroflexota bacterium]
MTVLAVFLIVFGLVGSAIISASEAGLISVNKIRVRHLAERGNRRASAVVRVVEEHEKFFATILLLNNVFNVVVATVGTSLAIRLWGNTGVVLGLATLCTTIALVVFGELTPKSLAVHASERWSLLIARPIRLLMTVSAPFVYVFTLVPLGIIRLLGGRQSLMTPTVTEGELRMLIDMGQKAGTVQTEQGAMLENIFRFGEAQVREVMTPRNDIAWVESDWTLRQFLARYGDIPHTRFPIYEDDTDDVIGILSIKDAMRSLAENPAQVEMSVTTLMRPPLFVPETKRLDDMLVSFRQGGHKMALVVDEFGGIAGLVTLNSIVERVVGRTGEEGLRPQEPFVTVDANTYEVDGSMSIEEANDRLGLGIPAGEYHTIAGFILEELQRVPSPGDRLRFNDLRFRIMAMTGNKIERVRVRRRVASAEPVPA